MLEWWGGSGRPLVYWLPDAHRWFQGLITSTSKPAKSLAFRVAITKSLALANPAISASASVKSQPSICARSRNVAAYSASRLSTGNML